MFLPNKNLYDFKILLCQIMYDLLQKGMNNGSAGNVSMRVEDGFLISPSAISPFDMKPEDIVLLNFQGEILQGKKPSSEWRFHRDIYLQRPEIGGIVHTHSMYSTTIACLKKEIPAFHYMIAMVGGDSIRCAPYALFGTQELSDYVIQALNERMACLMAHHGMISVGKDLHAAFQMSLEVENLAEQYWRLLQMGDVPLLSYSQMQDVLECFKSYKSQE